METKIQMFNLVIYQFPLKL